MVLNRELKGRILDIGGGGEGIMGRLYGEQVTAIDNMQEELDAAPDGFEKVLMNATGLKYEDGSFDNVTFFYTFMYMQAREQQQSLCEAARVLKAGGRVYIWDCDIVSAYPEPFCVELDICLPDERIHTTYGIVKTDVQTVASIKKMCAAAGLLVIAEQNHRGHFYLCCEKES